MKNIQLHFFKRYDSAWEASFKYARINNNLTNSYKLFVAATHVGDEIKP